MTKSWKEIKSEHGSRAGEPFDDFKLRRTYTRTDYPYHMPDGTVQYENCRYEFDANLLRPGMDEPKKKFLLRRPVGNGQYVYGIGDRRIIYNWPAIVKAGPGALVWVCEGEKKAKALNDRGLLATCTIGNHWTREEAAALTGYEAIILEDNDEQGRKNSAHAREMVSQFARSVRVVTAAHLWKHLGPEHSSKAPPPSGDIVNWLEYGGDAARLKDICLEIPTDADQITVEPYEFPAEQDIATYKWLLGRHLLRGEVAGTAAMGGTGKSNLSIVEALAMATRRQLTHDTVARQPLRVVLINLEDNRNTMDKRIAAAMRHYGITKADVGGRLIVIAKRELKIRVTRNVKGEVQRNERDVKRLTDLMIKKKADVLSVDSFIRTHGVNENDNSAIQEVVECFEDIATDANCAAHLWHHTRKGNGEGATIESSRGAQAFIDSCRSVRILETMTKKERDDLLGAVPDIGQAGWYFREFNGKRNFAPKAEDSNWFRYVSVELDNETSFEEGGDNVGVVTPWQYPKLDLSTARSQLGRESALAAVGRGGPWRASSRSEKEPWVGVPIAGALGLDLTDKRARNEVAKLIKDWIGAGLLRVVEGLDEKRTTREYVERVPQ